jgi:hypothetical protein
MMTDRSTSGAGISRGHTTVAAAHDVHTAKRMKVTLEQLG